MATSEAGIVDSKKGSKMNVEDEEAALSANVAAPVVVSSSSLRLSYRCTHQSFDFSPLFLFAMLDT